MNVEVFITAPLLVSAPEGTTSLSVCVFVSVSILPSVENEKRLTSPMLRLGIFNLVTISKVESSIRLKEREPMPMTVSLPSRLKLLSS
jgi:hypothetical protein